MPKITVSLITLVVSAVYWWEKEQTQAAKVTVLVIIILGAATALLMFFSLDKDITLFKLLLPTFHKFFGWFEVFMSPLKPVS